MKDHILRSIIPVMALFAGSAHAADIVKVAGTNVDFYYDADFWTLGASVSGNTISLMPGGIYQSDTVTDGAADPYQGPVYTATVDFTRPFAQSLIAVAHAGYKLNSDISSAGSATLQSNGSSGYAAYDLAHTYTSGTFNAGTFAAIAEIGASVEYRYFYYQMFGGGGDAGTVPLAPNPALGSHSAIAIDGQFHGTASVTGLGLAGVGLNSVSYSFGVSAVPEPGQYAMLSLGLGMIGLIARRRRRSMTAS